MSCGRCGKDLQAALGAALGASSQSQASQRDPLVAKLRSAVSGLVATCAASHTGGGLRQDDVVTVLSVAEFVAERLPGVFAGPLPLGLDAGALMRMLELTAAAAARYSPLLDRCVALLLRVTDTVPAAERRGLLTDLAAGAMELLLDAEQQLLLLTLPQPPQPPPAAPSPGSGIGGGGGVVVVPVVPGLGAAVSAFECVRARGLEQPREGGEEAGGGEGGEGLPELLVPLATVADCLAAAEAGCCLLSALLLHRPQLLAPRVPPFVSQALLQLLVAASSEPRTQAALLACAARVVALAGGGGPGGGGSGGGLFPPLAGEAEALLHVALSLLQAWCDGGVALGDRPPPGQPATAAAQDESASPARSPSPCPPASDSSPSASHSASPSASLLWHSSLAAALDAACGCLAAGGLLASHSDRLCRVLLRACLTALPASGPGSPPAATTPSGPAPASPFLGPLLHYLPRLASCLASCPHLLPAALEAGLLTLLLAPQLPDEEPEPPAALGVEEAVAAAGPLPPLPPGRPGAGAGVGSAADCIAAAARRHLRLPPRRPPAAAKAPAAVMAAAAGPGFTPGRGGGPPAAGGGGGDGGGRDDDADGAAPGAAAAAAAAAEAAERPSKRRRGAGAASGKSQQPAGKFGNLSQMFASQAAIKQRTLAEAARESGAPTDGAAGAAGVAAAAAAASTAGAAGSSGTGDGIGAYAGSGSGGRAAEEAEAAAAAARAYLLPSASLVVRLVAGLAPDAAGGDRGPGAAGAGAAAPAAALPPALPLALLERFTSQLLPPACPELLLMLAGAAADWGQRVAEEASAAAAAPTAATATAAAAGGALRRSHAAAVRAVCAVLLALLRERAAGGAGAGAGEGAALAPRRDRAPAAAGWGWGWGCPALAAALNAASLRLLRCLEALGLPPPPAASGAAAAPAAAARSPRDVAAGAVAVLVFTAAIVAGNGLLNSLAATPPLPAATAADAADAATPAASAAAAVAAEAAVLKRAFQGMFVRVTMRCAQLGPEVQGLGQEAGRGGGGDGSSSAADGPTWRPAARRRLEASGRNLVTRLLPVAILRDSVSEAWGHLAGGGHGGMEAADGGRLVFSSRLPDQLSAVSAELQGAALKAAAGSGSEAAMADAVRCLAGLLAARRPQQLAAVGLQALVQGLRQSRALLLHAAATPPRDAAAAAAASQPPPAASQAVGAAADALPRLPSHLWLEPLQPVLGFSTVPDLDPLRGPGSEPGSEAGGGAAVDASAPPPPAWPALPELLGLLEPCWALQDGAGAGGGSGGPGGRRMPPSPAVKLSALSALEVCGRGGGWGSTT
ncbi:hypothetical protein GPECTOR_3g12 [Gonium pectorale]|uniref:Uncharacterized protein n=1 Tax=Gonium pectorale TaxID=33097 RepID=A0A150GYP2_GONPE|nr:hypothetical protein GPECTOR_3g12 [Gonium pectorale]|eukprot:KXZ54951.1 hypothetical protein GPECTOR_3g12 [Gonium pectorale]